MHDFDGLQKIIRGGEQQVSVGGVYTHYRNPDQLYKVLAIALDEVTAQQCVVYQALYGDKLIWIRSVEIWRGSIEYEGKMVPRFIKKLNCEV